MVVYCGSFPRVSRYGKKFKMAELNDRLPTKSRNRTDQRSGRKHWFGVAKFGLKFVTSVQGNDWVRFLYLAACNDSACSSDHDEYSDPLEIAASAGASLSTPEKAGISRQRKVQTNPAEKKRNVRDSRSVDPNVSSWDTVKEFKDQC